MAEHQLDDGKRWIANLEKLGGALGYLPDPEYDVAQEGEPMTPVDMAWLRSTDDRFPLFLFEVESRAGGQLANNALKVFAQDTDLFEKPLFHFHAVLDGGESSNRVKNTLATFGKFNYRIYANATQGSGSEMVKDILSQHRRVSDRLDVDALALALDAASWPELDLDDVWAHAEACGFRVGWDGAYARLALEDPAFLARLTRRLESAIGRQTSLVVSIEQDGHEATAWEPLLYAAILAVVRPALAGRCFGVAQRIQGHGGERRLGPRYGQSAEYDDVIYADSPVLWAALAAALHAPEATAWVLEQLELVLGDPGRPTRAALSALSAVWMMHISRAAGHSCRAAFDRAAAHLDAVGGVAPGIWQEPPAVGGRMDDLDEWDTRISEGAGPAPAWEDLTSLAAGDVVTDELIEQLIGVLIGRGAADAVVVRRALWATGLGGQE